MRYTVTSELDPELFAELERERQVVGLSRSAGIRQAIEWWVAQRKEHGEERVGRYEKQHRQVMRRFDYVIGMIREQERLLGISTEDSPGGAASAEEWVGAERESEVASDPADEPIADARPPRSALAEARKKARRRVE